MPARNSIFFLSQSPERLIDVLKYDVNLIRKFRCGGFTELVITFSLKKLSEAPFRERRAQLAAFPVITRGLRH